MASSISGGTRPADPIITEQLLPSVEEQDNTCEICYTDVKEIVLCWNGHMACASCRDAMWTMRDCFGEVKRKCGFCREKLFDWGQSGLRDPMPSNHQPARPVYFGHIYRDWNNGVHPRITRERFEATLHEFMNNDLVDLTAVEYGRLFNVVNPDERHLQLQLFARLGITDTRDPQLFGQDGLQSRYRRQMFDFFHRRPGGGFAVVHVPLLHDRTRWFEYGAILTQANGRIEGLCNLPPTHPDASWLANVGFSEEQLFWSPNFERVAGAGTLHSRNRYKYIGRKGPKFLCDGFTNCWLPFPQKDYDNCTIGPRCGHCRELGHTAEWLQNPRRSVCPCGNDKDLYRKSRVDKFAILKC